MPLFFMISGFFASEKIDPIVGIKKKTLQLILPLFKYIIFFTLFFWVAGLIGIYKRTTFFESIEFNRLVIDSLISPTVPYCEPLWFLPCLWMAFIIFYLTQPFLIWINESRRNSIIGILLLILLYYSIVAGPNITSPIAILTRAIYACIFIYLGHISYKFKEQITKSKILYLLAVSAIIIKLLWFEGPAPWSNPSVPWFDVRTMGLSKKSFLLYSLLVTVAEVAFVTCLSVCIQKVRFLSKVFQFIGENSLHIFGSHLFIMWFIYHNFIVQSFHINRFLSSHPTILGLTYLLFGLLGTSTWIILYNRLIDKLHKKFV